MSCIVIALVTINQIACELPASQSGTFMLRSLNSPAVLGLLGGLYLGHDKHERFFAYSRTRLNGLLVLHCEKLQCIYELYVSI